MQKTITLDTNMFQDIMRVKEEFDAIVESIELMFNNEFMVSYSKAKQETENREFVDWNEL